MADYYCPKCRKTMAETKFFTHKDGRKFEICKACITLHIDNFDPETFLWALEYADVPYIEQEWNKIRDREYQKDPVKFNGMSVYGRYLGRMRLKQWRVDGVWRNSWADTDYWKEVYAQKKDESPQVEEREAAYDEKTQNIKESYERGEISEAQYQTFVSMSAPEPDFELRAAPEDTPTEKKRGPGRPKKSESSDSLYPVNDHPFEEVETIDFSALLEEEDKIFLALKWGKFYTAEEWLELEKLYLEMINSFEISDAARDTTLKMICKTSLKMNQAIDAGDVETYQKLSRVYDTMMKSAKFTEAQKKEEVVKDIDSVGELVRLCEKETGFIPEYEITADRDIIDAVLRDMQDFNASLIKEDPTVFKQIEDYIKKREIQDEMNEDEENGAELTDEDFIDYRASVEEQLDEDERIGELSPVELAEEEDGLETIRKHLEEKKNGENNS